MLVRVFALVGAQIKNLMRTIFFDFEKTIYECDLLFRQLSIKLSLSHALSREKKTKRRVTTDLLRSFALCLRLIVPLLYVGREARAKRKGIKKFSSSWEDEEEETITNEDHIVLNY